MGATPIIAPPAPASSPDGRAAFRPDIAGLRGVAVGAVVLYHAGVPFLGGGFVGVDVFFVISGFLMARLTVAEHARTGTVRIGAFYAWRIRRLLPMAAVVLAATLAAARLFVPPLLWPELSRVARSVAVYLTNYQLAADGTNYLASSEPSPFQHYWSLAVEEQFYLFWPLLLLVVLRRRRRWLAALLAAATAGSFALCVVQVVSSQPMAFFGLPTRAWEFGVGALCALLPAGERSSPRWAAVAGWVALALIGTAAVLYGPTVVYPGWASLPPVVGTGMILVAGRSGARGPILLRVAPMPWLGRISYSLYLWHWPLLIVPTLATGEDLGGPARAALVLAAVALAGLSERYIERPFRRNAFRLGTWTTLAGAAGVTALALVASVAVATLPTLAEPVVAGPSSAASAEGPEVVPADVTPALRDVAADLPVVYRDGCHLDIASTVPAPCRFGAPAGARRVMLLGDSHAAVWFPALETAAIDDRWSLTSLSKTACPLVDVPVEQVALRRPYVECEVWKANVVRRVWAERPNLVVLSAYSPAFRSLMLAPGDFDRTWADGLRRMIGLLPPGTAVVVLGDTPDWPRPPVDCLSGALDHARDCARPTTELTEGALTAAETEAVRAAGLASSRRRRGCARRGVRRSSGTRSSTATTTTSRPPSPGGSRPGCGPGSSSGRAGRHYRGNGNASRIVVVVGPFGWAGGGVGGVGDVGGGGGVGGVGVGGGGVGVGGGGVGVAGGGGDGVSDPVGVDGLPGRDPFDRGEVVTGVGEEAQVAGGGPVHGAPRVDPGSGFDPAQDDGQGDDLPARVGHVGGQLAESGAGGLPDGRGPGGEQLGGQLLPGDPVDRKPVADQGGGQVGPGPLGRGLNCPRVKKSAPWNG